MDAIEALRRAVAIGISFADRMQGHGGINAQSRASGW
jgi:hypothetical protein